MTKGFNFRLFLNGRGERAVVHFRSCLLVFTGEPPTTACLRRRIRLRYSPTSRPEGALRFRTPASRDSVAPQSCRGTSNTTLGFMRTLCPVRL
jgi:hypothetical protein